MGNLGKKLRNHIRNESYLYNPFDRRFSKEAFLEFEDSNKPTDDQDSLLLDLAVKTADTISNLREVLYKETCFNYSLELYIDTACGLANREILKIYLKQEPHFKAGLSSGRILDITEIMRGDSVSLGAESETSSIAYIEAVGDSFGCFLQEIYAYQAHPILPIKHVCPLDIEARVERAVSICSLIGSLRKLWEKSLWGEVVSKDNTSLFDFQINDEKKFQLFTIGLSRQLQNEALLARDLQNLHSEMQRVAPYFNSVSNAYLENGLLKISLSKLLSGKCSPPKTLPLLCYGGSPHIAALISQKSSLLEGRTALDAILVWELLHGICYQVLESFEKGNIELLFNSSLSLHRLDLVEVIRQSIGCTYAQSNIFVAIFMHSGRSRDGVWFKPLVRINDDHVSLNLASILSSAPMRIIETVLRELDIPIKVKGDLFEEFIREKLQTLLEANPNATDFFVKRFSFKKRFEKNREIELDIVFRVNETLFIAEAKSEFTPTTARSRTEFFDEVAKGIRKLKGKVAYLKSINFDFSNLVDGKTISNVILFGLTDQLHLTGVKIDDVPVIDWTALNIYFDRNKVPLGSTNIGQKRTSELEITYYDDPVSFGTNLVAYLYEPTVISSRLVKIKRETIKYPEHPDFDERLSEDIIIVGNGEQIYGDMRSYCLEVEKRWQRALATYA